MVFKEYVYDKFIFKIKEKIYYHKDGCWVEKINSRAKIGVTDFFQAINGDIASIDLYDTGTNIQQGEDLGDIETMKISFTITSPVGGKIIEHNKELIDSPELVNLDPYGKGWLAVLELDNFEKDRINLMDSDSYFDYLKIRVKEESNRKRDYEF